MSLQLSDLKKFHDKGLSLIWLRPKSKRPFELNWTKEEKKSWDELENSFEKSYNVGVRLGKSSKLTTGRYLGAIDCDVKSVTRKSRQELNDALRALGIDLKTAPIVMSGRGNGSKHIYVQTTEPMKALKYVQSPRKVKVLMPGDKDKPHSKVECRELTPRERSEGYRIRAAWEISFMGTGQQTVLPPSIHPDTGFRYEWASPLTVKNVPVFKPEKFVKQSTGVKKELTNGSDQFKACEVDLYSSRLPLYYIKQIESGEGCEDRSASLLAISMSMCKAQFTDNQILSVLSDPSNWISGAAYEHTQSSNRGRAVDWLRKYTLEKAKYATNIMRRFENPPKLVPLTKERAAKIKKAIIKEEDEKDWRLDLQRNQTGGYKTSLKNTELILSNTQNPKVLIHDMFSTRDSYGAETAWGGKIGEALSDIDIVKIRHWLSSSAWSIEPGKDTALDAVRFIADRNKRHPVREWLSSLEWDGKTRLGTWMKECLDAKAEEPYLSEVSRMLILAMVKRVFEPGCQWDYVVVLEGNQGTYKSTTARTLAGDKWFMDNLPDLRDKDAMLNLQGKWVIELGELADVKRGDYNAVKAYLNRRVDTVRSPYGMLQKDIPRQNVFIGTVNEGEYLKDPTGNRRFWPVKVGTCNVDKLQRMREQLFAEAMWLYENCFNGKLMMGDEANKQAKEAQADRRIDDDSSQMEEAFIEFIAINNSKPKSEKFDLSKFKIKDLFGKFGMPWQEWEGKGWTYNIAAQILSTHGFEKKKLGGQRWWFPIGASVGHHLKRCPNFLDGFNE